MSGQTAVIQNLGGFVWTIAEILRGDFKQSKYGNVNVCNLSRLTFDTLRGQDLRQLRNNLMDYINRDVSWKKDKKI